jgi:citrate lyase subunit beta/citryl-CoA lyase
MPSIVRPRRSVLYLPGSNSRAIAKSKTLDCDALILDLEDAVAPDAKAEARRLVADGLMEGGFGDRERIVRINGLDTPWAAADIAAIAPARPDALLVPKISRSDDIRRVRAALRAANADPQMQIWAMMETPLAILNAGAIAAAAPEEGAALTVLVAGTNDLAAETRARPDASRTAMLSWLSTCVVAARAFDLTVIDGVYNDFRDNPGFRAECEQGRDLGMDGKTLIHPNQVAICNEVFSPTEEEIEWASAVIAAFERPENLDKGVLTVEGRMVERLHARDAQRTVEIARRIGLLPGSRPEPAEATPRAAEGV